MILRIEFIDTETITMYKNLRCERHIYIFYDILKLEVTFTIISILLLYMREYVCTSSLIQKMLLLNSHYFINMCQGKDTPTIKCLKLYGGLSLMSGVFP